MSEYTGLYRGAVHDISDPERRGRLRLLIPAVLGGAPSGWAEPVLPTATTPIWRVGDRVWAMFEDGDINRPVYVSRMLVQGGDLADGAVDWDALSDAVLTYVQDTGVDVFYGDDPVPVDPDEGDLWIRDDGSMERFDGTTWTAFHDPGIQSALEAAGAAADLADSKVSLYYAPGGATHVGPTLDNLGDPLDADNTGDLWFETDNANKAYRWDGTTWVGLPFGFEALANDVQATLSNAITTYIGAATPTNPEDGDLWLKPEIAAGVPVNVLYSYDNGSWVRVDDPAAQQALSDALDAAELADGKMHIFYEATEPQTRESGDPFDATDIGDLWFDTASGNAPHQLTGFSPVTWSALTFGSDAIEDGAVTPDKVGGNGAPPASSPTPTVSPLGYSGVQIKWDPIVNEHQFTKYRVLFDSVNPPVQVLTTTAGVIAATSALPNGTPLEPGETYYARIIATDPDGDGPPSTVADGGPVAVPPDAVSVDVLVANDLYSREGYFGSVLAEQIETGNLEAALAIIGGLTIGTGITIDPDNGIQIITPTGDTHFPADGSRARIAGDLTANSLEVLGALEIRGTDNEISKSATVTMESGVTPPKASPIVTQTYQATSIHEGFNPRGLAYHTSRGLWYSTESLYGADVQAHTYNPTTNTYTLGLQGFSLTDLRPNDGIANALGGVTMINDNLFMLCRTTESIPGTYLGRWYVYQVNWTGSTWSYVRRWLYEPTGALGGNSPYTPTIGNDDGDIVVAQAGAAGGNNHLSRYTSTGTFVARRRFNEANGDAFSRDNDCVGIIKTAADTGVDVWYLVHRNLNHVFAFDPTTLDREPAYEFDTAASLTYGLAWDGVRFRSRSGATAHLYSKIKTNFLGRVGTTWRLADGTAPDYAAAETTLSPPALVDVSARAWMKMQSGTGIPNDSGDPNDPDAVSFYVSADQSSAPYLRAATPAVGVREATIDEVPTSGGNPPATTYGFSGYSDPARILSSASDIKGPIIDLQGDGTWRMGQYNHEDFRFVDTVTFGPPNANGLGLVAHGRGRAPTGVQVTSSNSLRAVSWSPATSDATYIGLYARNVSDASLYNGSFEVVITAWWDD